MNSHERILAHLAGQPVDRLPLMPITMQFACDLIGAKYNDYETDYRVLVEGQMCVAEGFEFDYVNTMSDPAREAADCGAVVEYFDNQPVAIVEEQALLADDLRVEDLPAAWNEKYVQYLGIRPGNDADGVLQDIHWAAGLVGYFPTYSLGNLYASQFFAQAEAELGSLAPQFAAGEFQPLGDWLREKIHAHGQCYSAAELVERTTGKPLSHAPMIAHLRNKLAPLYGLN